MAWAQVRELADGFDTTGEGLDEGGAFEANGLGEREGKGGGDDEILPRTRRRFRCRSIGARGRRRRSPRDRNGSVHSCRSQLG